MKFFQLLSTAFLITGMALAQSASADDLVTVPRQYVSKEGLETAALQKKTAQVGQYVGVGREIGAAIREGLDGVVDVSNKFAGTPVGQFTLVMVAWKILGQDLLQVVLGLPIYLAGWITWLWLYRRMFLGYWRRVLVEGKKTSQFVPRYEFRSRDAAATAGIVFSVSLIAWNVAWIAIIFG